MSGETPVLVQQGTLFAATDTNDTAQRHYWIPSVMTNGQGHMAIGVSVAGTNEFVNAATAGRLASDPPGTLRDVQVYTSSTAAYNPPGDPGGSFGRRWGDYSYTSVDPCDDQTMWTIQEFTNSTNQYGVRVVKLIAPPPVTPTTAMPATVPVGQSSVQVTISGPSVSGSGFFDPGPGFASRLQVSAGDVTVNSVTFDSPTQLTLDLNTVGATPGAKTITVTNPDGQSVTAAGLISVEGPPCSFSISPASQNFGHSGGSGSITVTADAGCEWTAVSNASFIHITSGASGTGNGTVNYTVDANPGDARTGTITVAGHTFTVNQDAPPPCSYSISPSAGFVSANGGVLSVNVTADAGCEWTAVSNAAFIQVTSGASGTGNGTVTLTVAANKTTSLHSGTVTIAGHTYTVTQTSGTCLTAVTPINGAVGANGGDNSVTVTAIASCNWTAVSTASWVAILSGGAGPGNKSLKYSVAPNPTTQPRTATILIGNLVHNIAQAAGTVSCSYSISPASQSFTIAGGNGSISVTATAGCAWTAVSNASFIQITSGASGTGSGTVTYSVQANPTTSPRTGTITIAGHTFTVNQAAGSAACSVTITPTNKSISAAGGTASVSVTSSCSWTAVSNVPWITILSGASGTGNGTVTYRVDPKTGGGSRTGTITIGNKTHTVKQ